MVVITWALGLCAMGVCSARRLVINAVATIVVLHVCNQQYFERFGSSPKTILVSGVVTMAMCVLLTKYNEHSSNEHYKLLSQSKKC